MNIFSILYKSYRFQNTVFLIFLTFVGFFQLLQLLLNFIIDICGDNNIKKNNNKEIKKKKKHFLMNTGGSL